MMSNEVKVAIIVDGELPVGLQANTAAVLALTIGWHHLDGMIGPDLLDGSDQRHLGITTIPLPILRATMDSIVELKAKAEAAGLTVVDFCDAAQTTTTYEAYAE